MSRTALAATLLLVALAIAGCTTPAPGPSGNNSTTTSTTGTSTSTPTTVTNNGQAYTPAQAQALLADAARDFPPEFGFEMKLTNNSTDLMTMKGLFDNTSKTSYVELKMDPSALGAQAGQADDMGMGDFFSNGITIYGTPLASIWIMNGTVFAIPADAKDAAGGMFGGQDPLAAFSELSDPHKLFANFSGTDDTNNDTVIKSITPTAYHGKSAVTIVGVTTKDGKTFESTIVLYTNPTLPAHIEGQLPPEPGEANSPLASGNMTMDFFYGAEVTTKVPDNAKRALGLAYKSDAAPFGGDQSKKNGTWTFLVSNGVATSEVELQVKDSEAAADSASSPASIGDLPTLWSMKLSDGTKTQDGVTLTFADNDHDSKVSAGDQVKLSWTGDGAPPTVVLYDTVSKYYVVPGVGAFAALAVLGLAAIALRKRN